MEKEIKILGHYFNSKEYKRELRAAERIKKSREIKW